MAAKLVTNGTGIKYEKSSSSDLIRRGAKDFSYLIGTIRWPTTVTAKPKTLRQKQNTSWQNQKPHGKNKIPHGKNKIPHGKTKNLTAKPNTSQQRQNNFGFAVAICFCHEVFGFAVRYFVVRYFDFAVRFLVLP